MMDPLVASQSFLKCCFVFTLVTTYSCTAMFAVHMIPKGILAHQFCITLVAIKSYTIMFHPGMLFDIS